MLRRGDFKGPNFDGLSHCIRVFFIGWFILFSGLGNQMTTVLGARALASPTSSRSGPTEEEDHISRIDTAPSKMAFRLLRRKPSRLLMGQRRDALAFFAPARRSVRDVKIVASRATEHAMRNGIGAPLRC